MCAFCESGEPVRVSERNCKASTRVIWEKGKWRLAFEIESYDVLAEMKLDVDYCPMCGRILDGRTER